MTKQSSEITLYRSKDGSVALDVQLEENTVWLNQAQLSDLFATERSVITKHLRNVFSSSELDKNRVCAKFAHTAADGKIYQTQFYNLDAIISVGYRVNSKRGTEFRIWATNVLKQHLVQGYSVNEKRLKALNQTLRLVADISKRKLLSGDEAKEERSVEPQRGTKKRKGDESQVHAYLRVGGLPLGEWCLLWEHGHGTGLRSQHRMLIDRRLQS